MGTTKMIYTLALALTLARTTTVASGHLEGQFHQPDCGCDSCAHAVTAPVLQKPHGAACDDSCSMYGVPVIEEQDMVGELGGHADPWDNHQDSHCCLQEHPEMRYLCADACLCKPTGCNCG